MAYDPAGKLHAIEWSEGPAPKRAFVVRTAQDRHFPDALHFNDIEPAAGETTSAPTIGSVASLTRAATFTRGGVTSPLTLTTTIQEGDVITTAAGGTVTLTFADKSRTSIAPSESLTMDEYVYDPNPTGDNDPSFLRKILNFAAKIIPQNDGDDVSLHEPGGGTGIRGDASDYTGIDPSTLKKAVEIIMGSPVKLYTAVSTPGEKFAVKFDYAFLDASQMLSVTLDGRTIFSTSAKKDGKGTMYHQSQIVSAPTLLGLTVAELAFHFEGNHGTRAVITNVSAPVHGQRKLRKFRCELVFVFHRWLGRVGCAGRADSRVFTGLLTNGTGSITIKVGANNHFTGTLVMGGKRYALSGKLDDRNPFTGSFGAPPVAVTMQATIGATDTGVVISGTAGGVAFSAYHAAYDPGQTAKEAGKYTLLLKPSDTGAAIPQGTGYATLTVTRRGVASLVAKLADGTAFSYSASLLAGSTGTQLLIYKPLIDPSVKPVGTRGLISGRVNFESLTASDLDGNLTWTKPEQTRAEYQGMFTTSLTTTGALYTPPAKGGSVLPGFTTGTLELSDNTIRLDKMMKLTPPGIFAVTDPLADKLKLTVLPGTGLCTGSFVYPATTTATKFGGVLFQKKTTAVGFFLGSNGSGTVSLPPGN